MPEELHEIPEGDAGAGGRSGEDVAEVVPAKGGDLRPARGRCAGPGPEEHSSLDPAGAWFSKEAVGECWRGGEPRELLDAPLPSSPASRVDLSDVRLSAVMAVSVVADGARLGVLYLDTHPERREFTGLALEWVSGIAGVMGARLAGRAKG